MCDDPSAVRYIYISTCTQTQWRHDLWSSREGLEITCALALLLLLFMQYTSQLTEHHIHTQHGEESMHVPAAGRGATIKVSTKFKGN